MESVIKDKRYDGVALSEQCFGVISSNNVLGTWQMTMLMHEKTCDSYSM